MFKKNEGFKQLDAFAISNNLSKKQKRIWDNSKEHKFFEEVFSKIDEKPFSVLFSNKHSRPNVPINQMVGALILKHLYNWTYNELFLNLNFNILTRHAIGIDSMQEDVFCEASIFNFQNKLINHFNQCKEDLLEGAFLKLTTQQISKFRVETSIQRGDSFLVGSNIINYSRLQLLIEVALRLYRILSKEDKNKFNELIAPYKTQTASNYIYQLSKSDIPNELNQIANLYSELYSKLSDRYTTKVEYINFERVYREHIIVKSGKIKARNAKRLSSSILMSPDDTEATYRDKGTSNSKGYVAHISETVNSNNQINLITDVVVKPNNIGDAEILEHRLPKMIKQTPNLIEYFADGQYGSPNVDKITEPSGIKLFQKAIRGRRSSAGLKIEQNSDSKYFVSCVGNQKIQAIEISEWKFKVEFDPEKCLNCKFKDECKIKSQGGKRTQKRKVYYFQKKHILSHKRRFNIDQLDETKKNYRANVEATVKEMKRGMKNGKVRVRNLQRISIHMILTALGINLTRIWAKTIHIF